MRTKLVLAALVAGVAALSPVTSASAQCDPEIIVGDGGGSGGCSNGCVETGNRYEALRGSLADKGVGGIPSYWDLFACTM